MSRTRRLYWLLRAFVRNERAASAVEYGLLIALIALGSIIAFQGMGNGLVSLFGSAQDGAGAKIENAASVVSN
ncbi:MAG: Flp family type IVb pilin [Hyphomicrobiaceae bacterium]|nr:Flp family type IVb pilin [Hyphomicrobiaceae bacterium]MCC0023847.1 Flp family type IVb pilin [Hyphomicrobiaceae bacterium]